MPTLRLFVASAVIVLAACRCTAVSAPTAATDQARAVYIRDAAALIADPVARAELGARLERREFVTVAPYGLGPLLATPATRATLAAWVDEVHAHGAQVIAPVAAPSRLDALGALVAEHPGTWFDGVVTEAEFWNRADRAAAFAEFLGLIAAMRGQALALAPGRELRVGAYLGYPTAVEAEQLAAALDFVFLDYSVASPAAAWSHVHARGGPLRARFAWFASAGVEAWPIFYAAGEVDMAAELRAVGVAGAEARFRADLAADRDFAALAVAGFVYFTLESLPR